MKPILLLETSVASRIAAGEVVERPVSVAKELLENSIDAGAKDIRMTLEQGGRASFAITDDGCGIPFDELPLAIERYATSKLRSLEDLERVATLGYRGEALSSVAAVSRLEIRSRAQGQSEGGMISVTGGVIEAHAKLPAMPGTRIQVDDLFFNMPARRRFLKSGTAELKRIIRIVQDYAIVRPDIRYRLTNDGRQMLDIGGVKTTDEMIASMWGEGERYGRAEGRSESVSARIWHAHMPGSKRMSTIIFVNGRRVQDTTVRSAISSAGGAVFGEWVVLIDMPPEDVDVNIHPAKSEVRFRKSGNIFEAVRRGADLVLKRKGGMSDETASSAPSGFHMPDDIPYRIEDRKSPPPPAAPEQSVTPSSVSLFSSDDVPSRDRRYLGQTQGGYLVFDDRRGLCLLDAHAAHERILYEQIEDAFSSRAIDTQRLLSPQEVPPAIAASVSTNRDLLRSMGFTFKLPEDEGSECASPVMVSLPAVKGLARLTPIEMLRSALIGIDEESDPSKRDREVWWRWARTACRDAVKLGETFGPDEALTLFDRLERCRVPYSCPHGRPTTIFLTGDRLKSWFER